MKPQRDTGYYYGAQSEQSQYERERDQADRVIPGLIDPVAQTPCRLKFRSQKNPAGAAANRFRLDQDFSNNIGLVSQLLKKRV